MRGVARRGGGLEACGGRRLPIPISARGKSRRRVSSWGGWRRLIPEWSWRLPGSGGKRSASRVGPTWSGGELELAQGLEGAFSDLAGNGESGHGRVAPLTGGPVE